MNRIFVLAIPALLLLSSCHEIFAKRIRGNGNIITQSRSAGSFNSIDVSGNIDVYARQDSSSSIKVETDENLQEYIDIYNEGEVLHIRPKEGYNLKSGRKIKVYVSAKDYKEFQASGACDIVGEGKITSSSDINFDLSGSCDVTMELQASKISSKLSGACSIKLKGETKDFSVDGSGSTDIKCMDLLAENVNVDISGAGDAEVYASTKLNVDVSGAGDIKYKGNAAVTEHRSGAGSIRKVE
jgi:hypothetical protein